MKALRLVLFGIVLALFALFAFSNWTRVPVVLPDGAIVSVFLPVVVFAAFLLRLAAGAAPPPRGARVVAAADGEGRAPARRRAVDRAARRGADRDDGLSAGAMSVFVALDTPDLARAQALARAVAPHVGGLKLGLEFFMANGPGRGSPDG